MNAAIALVLAILLAHPDRARAARAASEAHGVPYTVMLAVGLIERRLGEDASRDGRVVVWPHRGDVAQQANAAGHSLGRWFARCGSWASAAQFYHTSSCILRRCRTRGHHHGRAPYGIFVLSVAARIETALQP